MRRRASTRRQEQRGLHPIPAGRTLDHHVTKERDCCEDRGGGRWACA